MLSPVATAPGFVKSFFHPAGVAPSSRRPATLLRTGCNLPVSPQALQPLKLPPGSFPAFDGRLGDSDVHAAGRRLGDLQFAAIVHCHSAQLFHLVGVAHSLESLARPQKSETQTYVEKPRSTIVAIISRCGVSKVLISFQHVTSLTGQRMSK